jgi:hypothetical protein
MHVLLAALALASSAYPQDWVYYAKQTAVTPYARNHGGSWAGMTTASLYRYNPHLRYVRVARASSSGYCIEARIGAEAAMLAAPRGGLRTGTCAHPGRPAAANIYENAAFVIRYAVPAIEAWRIDHDGYTGMTTAGLLRYDDQLKQVKVVSASEKTYCVEARAGIWVAHKSGPAAAIASGHCPR